MPLIDPEELKNKSGHPCGECHLQPDEICDICGRHGWVKLGCNYPACDGGPSTGYCDVKCKP